MRVVLQRVSEAKVTIDGEISGKIDQGLVALVGIHGSDTMEEVKWMTRKIENLRIFEDDEGKMNVSVKDVGGEILVVSQFTLYGNAEKGNRPSFIEAAKPDEAEALYDKMVDHMKKKCTVNVETGEFGAMMDVSLVNDGPVTILLEK